MSQLVSADQAKTLSWRQWNALEPWAYVALLAASEAVSDLWQPVFGICLHIFLAGFILLRGAREIETTEGRFYVALSIAPMVRIISYAVAPSFNSHSVWFYMAAEGPLIAAAVAAARVTGLPVRQTLGWQRPRSLVVSVGIVLSGLVIGWGERFIIQPDSLSPNLQLPAVLVPAIVVIVFTGYVEETLFRGLLQTTATQWRGLTFAVLYTTVAWGFLHIGWYSVADVIYVMLVGLVWGFARYWNRSTLDLGLAHGLANVMIFIVLPNTHYQHLVHL